MSITFGMKVTALLMWTLRTAAAYSQSVVVNRGERFIPSSRAYISYITRQGKRLVNNSCNQCQHWEQDG